MTRPRLGAHVPTRGGAANAVDEAEARGAEAFQIFVSNPRAWAPPTISEEAAEGSAPGASRPATRRRSPMPLTW